MTKLHQHGVVRHSAALDVPTFVKSASAEEQIRRAIGANDFLNNMMDAERLRIVVAAMRSRTYAPDSRIIEEGEQGDHFYIAEEGDFEVLKADVVKSAFGAGVVFGELAILYKAKRFATIRVRGPAEARVWQLERQVFQKIMISTGCQEREQNIVFLGSVPVLKGVAPDVLEKMADLLKRVSVGGNMILILAYLQSNFCCSILFYLKTSISHYISFHWQRKICNDLILHKFTRIRATIFNNILQDFFLHKQEVS